jgi:uncharacterized XkdX family phage protein
MDYYKLVKRYYEAGYYDNEKVAIFVQYNKISVDQYKEITGEEYAAQ